MHRSRFFSAGWILLLTITTQFSCQQRPSKEDMLAGMGDEDLRALQSMNSTPLYVDGISTPSIKQSSEVRLSDDTKIIGVSHQGKHRAYPVSLLSGMMDHVVNDMVHSQDGNGVCPVTVTYCSMTDCVRVVTGDLHEGASHLDLGTLGLLDGGLALRWKGRQFKQNDQIEGLTDIPFELTTWEEWKSKHPETEVFAGRSKK
jgi:hypothetical protein